MSYGRADPAGSPHTYSHMTATKTAALRPAIDNPIDLPAMPVYMTTDEAATYLRFNVRTLANWRSAGKGPAYYTLGGRITYRLDELDEYMGRNRTPAGD